MAKVIGLDGKAISATGPQRDVLAAIEKLTAAMANGLQLDKILIIAEVTTKGDLSKVTHPTWDSGLSVAETVFLLETVKADIFEIIRRP